MALSLQRYVYDGRPAMNRILKERIEKEREASASTPMIEIGDILPQNVIVEILSWLPVKSLLQFKSVCKSWYAIISTPAFVSKHLKNYYDSSSIDVLLVQDYLTHAELELLELLVDDTPRIVASQDIDGMPVHRPYICGPCDGLYYLYDSYEDVHVLWNPAINEFKVLPPIITKPDFPSDLKYAPYSEAYGFGYDPTNNDYKLVVIKGCTEKIYDEESRVTYPHSVLVYSVRTDSWKYCTDLPRSYYLDHNKCYVVLDGCFYWLRYHEPLGNPQMVISFDMRSDTIQEIQIPDYDQLAFTNLAIYDDSVAFLAIHEKEKRLDIWTLNKGIWAKKITMGLPESVRPSAGHWKKNKLILQALDGRLVLCDPHTQETTDLRFKVLNSCQGVYVYRESLLSLKDWRRWRAQ